MNESMKETLEYAVENFPSRASGEDLYDYINKLAIKLILKSRPEFIMVMIYWIQLRSEPKTMLAVDIAGKNQLGELRDSIEELLEDVNEGKAFKPFYETPIKNALKKI